MFGPLRILLPWKELARFVLARYVVRLEPLATADPDLVVALVGPTIQGYLTGPLPAS